MSNVVRIYPSTDTEPSADREAVRRRRAELGAFLRARRTALRPSDVGLPPAGRRHVKGLRREEVAQLAEIGTSWYTLLEQGRVRNIGESTLERIALALRLSETEKAHLRTLARNSFQGERSDTAPDEATIHFVERFDLGPALLVSASFDVAAANDQAKDLYGITLGGSGWNLIEHMLLDERLHEIFPRWENTVRNMVGVLRGNYAHFGGDLLEAAIERLRRSSAAFDRLWDAREVYTVPSELCAVQHPQLGFMTMQLHALVHTASESHIIVCLTPAPHAVSSDS